MTFVLKQEGLPALAMLLDTALAHRHLRRAAPYSPLQTVHANRVMAGDFAIRRGHRISLAWLSDVVGSPNCMLLQA